MRKWELSEVPTQQEIEAITRKLFYPLVDAIEIWQDASPESSNLTYKLTTKNNNNYTVVIRRDS